MGYIRKVNICVDIGRQLSELLMRETLNLFDSNYFSVNEQDTKIDQLDKQKQCFSRPDFTYR